MREKYNLLEGPSTDCCIHCCCCTACAGEFRAHSSMGRSDGHHELYGGRRIILRAYHGRARCVQRLALHVRYCSYSSSCGMMHPQQVVLNTMHRVTAVCQEGNELKTRKKMPPPSPMELRVPSNIRHYPQVCSYTPE